VLELTSAQKVVLALAVVMLGGSGAYLFSIRSSAPALPPQQLYQQPATGQDSVELVVQITGEVKRPGIYRVRPGLRVYELVQMAGGFTQRADQEAVNLAQLLEDGQKVAVPRLPEPEPLTALPAPATALLSFFANCRRASVSDNQAIGPTAYPALYR